MSGGYSVQNALAVRNGRINGSDRRSEVWHNNRATISFTGIRHDSFQHVAIAKVKVPVVWAADL